MSLKPMAEMTIEEVQTFFKDLQCSLNSLLYPKMKYVMVVFDEGGKAGYASNFSTKLLNS